RTNACIPGGDAVSRKISAIMGSAYADVEEQAAVVRCGGNCGVTCKKYEYEGELSCDAVSRLYGGDGACPAGCIGLGDCVKACPFGAISVQNGAAAVNRALCTGCGLCAKACPKGLIGLFAAEKTVEVLCRSPLNGKATMAACKAGCIGCKKCERNCPSDAIHVQNNHAVIDHEKCTGCGACAEGCPTHCIHLL
ncbi:MAG TPA: 4Fe-4S binding protein, partial [Candidatus Merdivicinus intestinavium]|nr:4Fe-4S binding protein [Candidatus Merdivicinus intestinavium]